MPKADPVRTVVAGPAADATRLAKPPVHLWFEPDHDGRGIPEGLLEGGEALAAVLLQRLGVGAGDEGDDGVDLLAADLVPASSSRVLRRLVRVFMTPPRGRVRGAAW